MKPKDLNELKEQIKEDRLDFEPPRIKGGYIDIHAGERANCNRISNLEKRVKELEKAIELLNKTK